MWCQLGLLNTSSCLMSVSVLAGDIAKEVLTEAKHAQVESDKPATQTDGKFPCKAA